MAFVTNNNIAANLSQFEFNSFGKVFLMNKNRFRNEKRYNE